MKVLVACEESQAVCKAFRARGHEAYSCDIQPPSGGHPEWHIQGDALMAMRGGHLTTMDGQTHDIDKWDMMIAHPPCTYLTSAGSRWLFDSEHQVKDRDRFEKMQEAAEFFRQVLNAPILRICVENPAPMKIAGLPEYSQIIEPYQFGDPWKKRTCLWLWGLEKLEPTKIVEPIGCWTVSGGGSSCRIKKGYQKTKVRSAKERAKTFPGIAAAMADQWG